ncbi:uncharacterized protein LOC113360921 [Papaver somniferum]|uniref:uncharacterized protein LOC113360921 n=1 Tax=Papaver somniferum TaxID=3469 RepID=UPI000E7052F6|nr:uncharacterized protein LOC113360921 [Papaver somniferum]
MASVKWEEKKKEEHHLVSLKNGEQRKENMKVKVDMGQPVLRMYLPNYQPTRTKVVQVLSRLHLKMRVWERGARATLACGKHSVQFDLARMTDYGGGWPSAHATFCFSACFARVYMLVHQWNSHEKVEPQFNYQYDALNIRGHSPEQKVTSALRILGYGRPPDSNDEYLRIDVREILKQNQERGFSGMLGSLDCIHWVWTGCPTYWAGQYKGHYTKPTVILEAAASYDRCIWHAFFGLSGSQNDINFGQKSPLFEDLKYGISPQVNFSINGNHYTHGYYLADGIYPKWSTLGQCYCQPPAGEMGRSYSYFNSKQMNLRKDLERAFGIPKRKFAIICGPYRGLSAREMHKTMLTCIIMHNMAIQETRRNKKWTNHQDEDLRPEIIPARGLPARNYAQMTSQIENRTLYNRLREDLRVDLWAEFGRDGGRIE